MRGQAHTLEALTAALLVIGGIVFALQATAVTPLSASTSNQHIENQQRAQAADVLATTDARDALRPATVDWNASDERFRGTTDERYHTNAGPPNEFGAALNETFGDERIAFNVHVRYRRPDGRSDDARMVYMGTPSDNAASASRTTVLYDDTPLPGNQGNVSAAAANGGFYAADAAPNGTLFNVMEVRIVVWRI